MSIDCGTSLSPRRRSKRSGVALVVTLALLVLVTATVVAFFSRTTANQQITSGSSQGVTTNAFTDGVTQEVIGGLQKEMWDLSGASQTGSKIFPIPPLPSSVTNRIQNVVPTRMVGPNVPTFPGDGSAPDPNAGYSQFANLVKQSYTGIATYKGTSGIDGNGAAGPNATGPLNASSISTVTPAVGGRQHDGIYWNQPQFTSISSTSSTAATDLVPLVPNWVYTTRAGDHPTSYASNLQPSTGSSLSTTSVVGRYAYNIYDIGGLLNANVAGYGPGVATQPAYTNKSTMIVPGYKGSVLMADLSGLNLNGTLTVDGANANTFASSNPVKLPTFRYSQSWANDFSKIFASGQFAGWLRPFLSTYDPATATGYTAPGGATFLKNNAFTSRQDLITWVNSQLGAGTASASWALPYLTHFSYDTDAPSFTPNVNRPYSNVTLGSGGGNDSSKANDQLANPAFTTVLDTNGAPLIKHRFPLSTLALLDNIYPGQVPADLLDPNSTLYKQIQYDFGLVWNSSYNCWDYKTVDADSYIGIKQLRTASNTDPVKTIPNTRSPNFFELLKAAINAGSLGKEWGAGSFDGDSDNSLSPATGANSRYSATTYQIIQIGANIISQTTSNYCPTAICLNRNGQAPIIYGVKDLPYFYRSRLLALTVDTFKATSDGHQPMYDKNAKQYSLLTAIMVQPELWNPHAPNLLASTANYPKAFRIVPQTTAAVGVNTTSAAPAANQPSQWQEGTGSSVMSGNYNTIGGPYCLPNLSYNASTPDAYISFGWDAANSDLLPKAPDPMNGSALGSFREPCPLAAPGFPPNINLDSSPKGPTMSVGYKVSWDKLPNTQVTSQLPVTSQNVIPARFSTAKPSNTAMGFLVAYCCTGPGGADLTQIKAVTGGPLLLNLQYSIDGASFYTYDTIQSSFPGGQTEAAPPSGVQQSYTGVRTDPRTNRWGMIWTNIPNGQYIYGNPIFTSGKDYDNLSGLTYSPSSNLGTTNYGTTGNLSSFPQAPGWIGMLHPDLTLVPSHAIQLAWTQVNQSTAPGYYQDPDGVVRKADGAYVNTSGMAGASGSTASAVGLPQAQLAEYGNSQGTAPGITGYESRPIILNRPFQSVAELGYAFRDTPWKSLDFFTPESGDNALLDVFSIYGPDPYSYANTLTTETGLVAGKVNLNTRQQPVLAVLLQGAATATVFSSTSAGALTTLGADQAAKIAQALVQWTTNTSGVLQGPLLNPAELVGKYTDSTTTPYSGFSSTVTSALAGTTTPASPASIIKQQRECVMHALADAGTTRTWNLLIDLVAQTGQLTPNATGLQSFSVSGERHVWVSVALDRVTGKVIKMQVEPVRL